MNALERTVLIVDDNSSNLQVLRSLLSKYGCQTRFATNGTLALDSVRAERPDLILLDIKMPDMSGYAVCRQLKADKRTNDIPILFISVLDEPLDKVKAFEVGGVDYITKPFQADEVLARIKTHMALSGIQLLLEQQNIQLKKSNVRLKHEIQVRKIVEDQLKCANEELERRVEERTAKLVQANVSLKAEIGIRKKAEEALQESEEKYRLLVENANEAILVAQDEKLKFVNPKTEEISGYSMEELMSRLFGDFVHPDDREMVTKHHVERLAGEKEPEVYDLRITDKNGDIRWLRNSGVVINWVGKPATLNIMTDITKQKRMEDALKKSELKFRNLFLESPIGIEVYDSEGRLLNINKSSLDLFGVSNPEEIEGINLFEDPNLTDQTKEMLRKGETVRIEGETVRLDALPDSEKVKEISLRKAIKSGVTYLDVLITPLGPNRDKPVTGFLVQIQDITERKRSEKQVYALTRELIKAQENERQVIAHELHDCVAQDLSALKIGCDTVQDNSSGVTSEVRKTLTELSKTLEKTIAAVRDLAYELRPPGLERLGLTQTIFQQCKDFSFRTGIKVDFSSIGTDELGLDFDTRIMLYRLIQESLRNAEKHADASNVWIKLVPCFPKMVIRIEDNGNGFDVKNRLDEAFSEKRLGIKNMQERVALLNGEMEIESRLMQGTKILIEIPLKGGTK